MDWLVSEGYALYLPLGHSPDTDLVAERDGRLIRVQVKTTTRREMSGNYTVAICTRGGNQSWNKIVKRFAASRCDYLFVLVANGRRWFIPSEAIEATTCIVLGGAKYAEYEVEQGRPILSAAA